MSILGKKSKSPISTGFIHRQHKKWKQLLSQNNKAEVKAPQTCTRWRYLWLENDFLSFGRNLKKASWTRPLWTLTCWVYGFSNSFWVMFGPPKPLIKTLIITHGEYEVFLCIFSNTVWSSDHLLVELLHYMPDSSFLWGDIQDETGQKQECW